MATLVKEAAGAMAAVEVQQQRLTLQQLIAMNAIIIGEFCRYLINLRQRCCQSVNVLKPLQVQLLMVPCHLHHMKKLTLYLLLRCMMDQQMLLPRRGNTCLSG